MADIHVGISGWTYAPWRGVFYPRGWAQRRELEYCCGKFNSIEINGSFYSLQTPASYRQWSQDSPPGFTFAVKGGRFISHMKKLNDVRVPLANFFASGILLLGAKLGPVLWQFPPNLGFLPGRFDAFLQLLPRTQEQAAKLASEHDERLVGRSWTQALHQGPLRYAFEVRHASFLCSEAIELFRRHGVALVFADTAGAWPYTEDVTADFVYLRLHGAEQLYASGYTDDQLAWWAQRIRAWHAGSEPADARRVGAATAPTSGRDVYVYFDNDAKVHAPFDAMRLARLLGGCADDGQPPSLGGGGP
jgi:uncharacterized protein YecE (DUF72 family)